MVKRQPWRFCCGRYHLRYRVHGENLTLDPQVLRENNDWKVRYG